MVRLPKSIEKQLREVEELEKQMRPSQEEGDEVPDSQSDDTDVSVDIEENTSTDIDETTTRQPSEEREDSLELWQQRYRSLQGKYNAEVPRLYDQINELTVQLNATKKELEALKKGVEESPKEKAKTIYVTDEDKETFGEDLIELQRRVAKETFSEFETVINDLRKENEELKKQLQQTVGQVKLTGFEQKLLQLVPDFPQINADPRWVEWLNEVDPVLRAPRRLAAQHAYDSGDAEGVAHYVKLWKQTIEGQEEIKKRESREAELRRQQAPKNVSGSVGNFDSSAKTYTETEISKLWDRVREFTVRGRMDEAQRIESEIMDAFRTGRIMFGR